MRDMTCDDCARWLHAYLDNELDTTTAGAQHAHLDGCPACAARLSELQALRTRICQQATYYPVPPSLENRIRIALDIPLAQPLPAVTPWHRPARWVGLGLGGAVAGTVALVMSLVPHLIPPSDADRLAEELVADHVRSLMADHLTDIASSDQHTVKPWFNGRLDFSPPVHDLTLDGFPLVGGRLDYLHGRTVAALVYRRRGHLINVFIWPASGAARTVPELTIRQGYHLLQWSQAGMAFQTISDLNLEELAQFVQHLRQ